MGGDGRRGVKHQIENRTLEKLLSAAKAWDYINSWLGIGIQPLEKSDYWTLNQRVISLISCIRKCLCASPPFFFSGILIFSSLHGYSDTQNLCPELGTENFRDSRLHTLQQELSTTKYFYQVSSLSSDYCPIHIAICFQIQLQLLSGRFSAYHSHFMATLFILLFGVQTALCHLPANESEFCTFTVYSLLIILYQFDDSFFLSGRSACSGAPPNTFVTVLLFCAPPGESGHRIDGDAKETSITTVCISSRKTSYHRLSYKVVLN